MVWSFQSNMTKGELDPQLAGRIDIEPYYNGLATAENVLVIPQGGVKKRPGMEYIATGLGSGRLEPFSFSTTQNYLLAFTDLKMEVYKDGVLQATVTTPWTLAQIQEFDYIQSADTIIITHEDHQPRKIVRNSDISWTVSAISFVNVPQYDYDDGSSPTPVTQTQDLTFSSTWNAGDTFKIALDGLQTEEINHVGRDTNEKIDDTGELIETELQNLINTASTGVAVTIIDYGALGANPAIFRVSFSGASADDWPLLVGTPIQAVDGSTSNRITASVTAAGTTRKENVWSSTRGFQRTATFHEGRLWFGGSRDRVSTIWGSRSNDFFNFDAGKALDDEAIDVTLDTDQVNAINGIFSNRGLQVFTTGAEFSLAESPATPANVAFKGQTNFGSRRIRPVSLSGATIYAQATGKSLNQFVFTFQENAFDTLPLSVLSPHLISSPSQLAVKRGGSGSDANYIYIVNDDGNLTVFNSLPQEGVAGFTSWKTTGNIKSVAVVDAELHLLVEREVNSVTVYYIEKENEILNTDSAVRATGLASDTLTGLAHLNTETVKVKADGAVQDDEVVSGGQIVIGRTADTIEAGLEYLPIITTMPLNIALKGGSIVASKKRIKRVALEIYKSNGIIVQDQRIADKTIGQDQFDAPAPQSGMRRIFLHGWSLTAQITITQDTPMPLQILNIGLEVKT